MKQRYTIGEVSKLLGVKQHVIRYWEEEVPFLAPKKSKSGRRVYTDRELQLLLRLKHLLYEKRYTIEGARERIWKETSSAAPASSPPTWSRGDASSTSLVTQAHPALRLLRCLQRLIQVPQYVLDVLDAD